jgi:hypothetical protein
MSRKTLSEGGSGITARLDIAGWVAASGGALRLIKVLLEGIVPARGTDIAGK